MADCPHRPPCPGCPRFAEPGLDLIAREGLAQLARRYGIPEPPVVSGPPFGFRHRARLAIRGRLGSPKLGLFELGTHRVVHIPSCLVQHPLINRVAGVVRRALVEARLYSYSDQAHLGLARYLQVVVERKSQTAQVVLVANAEASASLAGCLDLIRKELDGALHSLWFNAHCDRSNTVLGPKFERWCGPESIEERFGGAAVYYPPGAFGQSNLEVAQLIVEHLRQEIPEGSCVAEFYAGVGAIGLSVIDRTRELRLNESSPYALGGLEQGLAALDGPQRAKVIVQPGPAGAMREAAVGADVVIADPPRKGLEPALAQELAEHPPERLLYVSCALDSLQEDIVRLTSGRALRLVGLTVFDMFPYTAHVETVARFERA
jgi:tRNA/tmRNA/rRNA uracil-C5-methylase (TrmA/RlmC/RlmD family)